MIETPSATILIVDDMPENITVLRQLLTEHGYRTRPAISGEVALHVTQNTPPDLILLDIMMPDMDGFEVCRQLKAEEDLRDIPVIFLSALSDPVEKVKAFALGGVDYITKPFHAEEVLARVQTHVSLRQTQQQLLSQNRQLQQEIAERQRIAAELKMAKEAAEAANRAKSIFLANMSHELRTPLNAILGFARFISRDATLSPHHQEHLAIINRSGEHLLNLLNDILELSKIEAGRMDIHPVAFDLHVLLQDTTDMFRPRAAQKGLTLHLEYDPDLPRYMIADVAKLRQIVINLLSNAIKFTERGSVTLRILDLGFEILDLQKSKIKNLKFEIIDTGIGIAAEDRERIFKPFEQVVTPAMPQGTGLGLTITQQYLRLMGGTLSVESEIGKGSIFSCTLPVELINQASLCMLHASIPRRVIGLEPGQPAYRILIVEDDAENRQLLKILLESTGFVVREAVNGQAALDLFITWQPHLIWMDMRMPLMDGYAATRAIRSAEKSQISNLKSQIPIIALTASSFEEDRAKILDIGCNDFVRKPFQEDEIFEMIRTYVSVRYVYASAGAQCPVPLLTPEALAALPPELPEALAQAIDGLDEQWIQQVIAAIRLHNGALADTLTALVKRFDYDAIMAWISA